ncbi:MAG: hypothetical protein NZZ41_06930 [Candidatus Dojkabacteria bacterium]|nr:hypothetical protein [Candidatus Dojkabacteria bacterium]
MTTFTKKRISTESAAKNMSKLIARNFGGKLVKDKQVVEKIKALVRAAKASMDTNYFVSCALVKQKNRYIFAVSNYMIRKPHIASFDVYAEYASVEDFLNSNIDPIELVLLPIQA